MPDFSPCPINNNDEVNQWLQFYEMTAPLTVLSVLVSRDPGLDLRVEHSHGWGEENQGGHYHYDTSPDTVEYTGYYNIADTCYRSKVSNIMTDNLYDLHSGLTNLWTHTTLDEINNVNDYLIERSQETNKLTRHDMKLF